MRLLIKYGSHGQHEDLVPIETVGIVDGKLVLGFTRTKKGYIYGRTLHNSQILRYYS